MEAKSSKLMEPLLHSQLHLIWIPHSTVLKPKLQAVSLSGLDCKDQLGVGTVFKCLGTQAAIEGIMDDLDPAQPLRQALQTSCREPV